MSYFDYTNYYFDIGKSDMDTFYDSGQPVDKKGNPVEIKYRIHPKTIQVNVTVPGQKKRRKNESRKA